MAAQVEVQPGEVGRAVAGGRLHLNRLTDSSNTNLIDIPVINQVRIIASEPNKPVPAPKPRLCPKPFAVDRNPTIKPILAPKPQTKPRLESTHLPGHKPEPPSNPKPLQPVTSGKHTLVSSNPSRPAPTSFKTLNKFNTGQTTKPIAQPFKPAPPFDPGVTTKPSPPVLTERQKPSGPSYAKILKNLQAAEWSGTTQREEEGQKAQSTFGTSITRAKSLGFLLDVGQEVEKQSLPEAPVQLRAHSRGTRARPVSSIFPESLSKTETPVPAPRWVGRRPLSVDLTSKFEPFGLSTYHKSLIADMQENTIEEKSNSLKSEQDKITPQRSKYPGNPALTGQSINKAEETSVKETDDDYDDKRRASVKSRISLLLDSSATLGPSGQGSDIPPSVHLPNETESTLGVKMLIKQLTEDTTPTQSPVLKSTLKPRPLPHDRTKRFSSERSPDLVSLSEAADRHDIIKDPQRRAEDSVVFLFDQKTFPDSRGSQEQLRKPSTPEGPGSGPGGAVHTVRASLFENFVERHSVFLMDDVDSHSSPSSRRRDLDDDGSLFVATYQEPASPSSPQQVRHAFDTVQAIEKNRAVSELVPSAQWEDKAMTLRSKRSDVSKSTADGSPPAQRPSASSMTAEPQLRYLRVGALTKWDHSNQDQSSSMEKGIQKEAQREGKERLLEQDDAAAAPKRIKILPTEEQSKPRATYFALTGQLQEPLFPGEVGTSVGDIGNHSARSALSGLQGKSLSMRRNPTVEEAFGKTSHSQEKVEDLMMKSHLSSRNLMELEKQRLNERKESEAAEKIRQVALDQEIFRILELKGRQREADHRSVFNEHRKEEILDSPKKRDLQKETEKRMAKLKEIEKEKQRHLEMEKQAHREFAQMKELEMQREAERQRQKVYEKQKRESEEKQRAVEMQKQIELERQRLQEAQDKFKEFERERQQQLEREMRREAERMQERERKKQREEERQRELEKERRQLALQKEKQKIEEMERVKEQERQQLLEYQKQMQKEKEHQQMKELENQRLREKKEREQAEKMKQMALEQEMLRLRELDKERERQKEMERERQKEIEREKQRQEQERQLELQKQKQREKERQQLLELEKQRRREKKEREEAEKIKQIALEQEMLRIRELDKERERQKEMERQKEIEREKQRALEQQRQRDLERERQRQLDAERQELENQRLRQQQQEREKKRLEELERLKEMERQQLLEFEKRRLREKMEKDDAENMRQIAKQQEAERQRLKEKQRKDEQERLRQESAPMRPKVLDLDSVLRNEPLAKAPAQRSDPSNRWKEPYKPAILDIDSFSSQAQHSPAKDLFPVSGIQGLESDWHTPERDPSWKVPPQTSGSFSSPVWTTTPQDPWELLPVEMSVDKPVADQRKPASRPSFRQDEKSSNPLRSWPTPQDQPLNLDLFLGADTRAANTPGGPSSSSSSELIWLPKELQPHDVRAAAHSPRRSQESQDLNRMRSRSVSRRSAPASSSAEGNLSRVRSRSAHREQDRHSWVPQKQGDEEGKDSGTPVRDNDSQYGTWETGLRTDDSLTPATPSSESHLSPSPKKPTTPLTPGDAASPSQTDAPDGVPPPSSSEDQPFTFPDAPAALLDTSVLRSRVQLGKKRAPRTRPTRAARQTVAPAEGQSADDWLYRDSTDAKPERKEDDSDSEEPARGAEASPPVASQPQRVAIFPGMDPSALKAQLRKRGDSDNQVDGAAAASPSQLSRSPKSPFLPRAARVLPPAGGKENGEEDSPQWLKELKSKKRLSQYESES